jgi:CHAT domain-containing protein
VSLLESNPELLVFRDLRAWWDLRATVDAVPLEAQAVEAAFAAWAANDQEWGDDPGAAAHEALARDIRSALEDGVPQAFAARAAAREAAAPEELRDGLRRVDESASEYLRDGDRDALAAAGETLDELLRSSSFADADPLLKLAVYSDGAQLFEALLRASQDDEMLRRVIACCEMTLQFRRRLDQHPPAVLLSLDPRLQSMAGLLGKRLGTRYARRGDPKDLMRAVQMAEWALGLTATSAPDYPLRLEERAVALGYRRDEASIAIANDSMRRAAELEPVFSPVRAHFRLQHGRGLVELYRRTRLGDVLDEAIAVLRQARGEARPELLQTLAHSLGAALRLRYDRDRDRETLDEASDLVRQAVQAESGPIQDGDQRLEELYVVVERLADRYAASGEQVDLDRALRAFLVAVQRTLTLAAGPGEWLAGELDSLIARGADAPDAIARYAAPIRAMYNETNADVYLETAIRLFRFAAAAERQPARRAALLSELAHTLSLRYRRDGLQTDLDEAVAYAEAAVTTALGTTDEHLVAVARNTLGSIIAVRFERSGNSDDLQRAITEVELALADRELLEPARLSGFLSNLGALLRMRADHLRVPGEEQRALDILVDALDVAETYHTESLASSLHNVAAARHALFERTRRRSDLDQAIGDFRRALELQGQAELGTRFGLALALLDRHALDPKTYAADLDEALALLETTIAEAADRSPDWPSYANALARALEERAQRDEAPGDLDRARELCVEACERGLDVSLEYALFTAYDWGGRATARDAWEEAARAYTYGLRALQRLVGPQALRSGKIAWLRQAWGVSANAAYAWAKTGDAATAVVALEGTRGLLLSEASAADRFSLDRLEETPYRVLADRFRAAVDRWGSLARALTAGAAVDSAEVDAARAALDSAIDAIRTIPGFEGFLGYPTIDDVRSAAVQPLAYLVPAQSGGVALIVRPDGTEVEAVWLSRLTEEGVRLQANTFFTAYWNRHRERERWAAALDDVTRWLCDVAMGPVLAQLDVDRVVLIPTGLLGLLPLHAAWTEDKTAPSGRRYAIDEAVISFASTAQALRTGQRLAANVQPTGLLAVLEPEPVSAPRLPHAEGEVAAATSWFERCRVFRGRQATVERVVPTMPEFPVLHFACHARSSVVDPSLGGVALAFDRLLGPDGLARLQLPQALLVVLSACETGVYGAEVPDEAIGLPTALAEARVAGILASLWEVDDAGAMMLVARFYELWRLEDCDPAEALVRAQRWLRDTTNAEKRSLWTESWRNGELPEATFDAATTDTLYREPDALDFAHPVHWAAFTFTGAW